MKLIVSSSTIDRREKWTNLFHLLIIDGLISRFGIGRPLLDLFLLILHEFGEENFFSLINGILSSVNDTIVLTWNGLRRQTHRYLWKRQRERTYCIHFWIFKPNIHWCRDDWVLHRQTFVYRDRQSTFFPEDHEPMQLSEREREREVCVPVSLLCSESTGNNWSGNNLSKEYPVYFGRFSTWFLTVGWSWLGKSLDGVPNCSMILFEWSIPSNEESTSSSSSLRAVRFWKDHLTTNHLSEDTSNWPKIN